MQMNEQVLTALEVLRNFAENEFELHRIDVLEQDLTAPPKAEIVDQSIKKNPKLINLTGQKFGKLTVIEYAGSNSSHNALWLCLCDCGNRIIANGKLLKNGNTSSCGCIRRFRPQKKRTHGMTNTPIYKTWIGIKNRCFNPNSTYYTDYGGRGITMFPAWVHNFQAFYNYVSQLPHFGEEDYTLDRIDNDCNYEPGNLRWADSKTQSRNRRNVNLVMYNGEMTPITEAAELSGISLWTLRDRLRRGEVSEELLFRPVKKHNHS